MKLAWLLLFSLLSVFVITVDAQAKEAQSVIAKKKKSVKKPVSAKRSITKRASVKKRRSESRRIAKSSRTRKPVHKSLVTRNKHGERLTARTRVAYTKRHAKRVPAAPIIRFGSDPSDLKSSVAYIYDPERFEVLYEKNAKEALPIASLTKLMTALVVVEAKQDMNEVLEVTKEDIDTIKYTSSRLPIGSKLSRSNMLHIALMSSENRAASALGRHYPGGLPAFIDAMNAKAKELGMKDTHYVEPTGLSPHNVSSARDLAKLVMAAHEHPLIRKYSTHKEYEVDIGGPVLQYRNSNRLISYSSWDIELQKTGYISEAGRCLVMKAYIKGRSIIMVFLGSQGKYSRAADASTIRRWLEETKLPEMAEVTNAVPG